MTDVKRYIFDTPTERVDMVLRSDYDALAKKLDRYERRSESGECLADAIELSEEVERLRGELEHIRTDAKRLFSVMSIVNAKRRAGIVMMPDADAERIDKLLFSLSEDDIEMTRLQPTPKQEGKE